MIFVTVGTHEQPFNRLIEEIDCLKKENLIQEEVVIQSGYCTYEPKYCQYSKMIGYDEMQSYMNQARIVITHGGPASFMQVIQMGKTPIVVPRQKKYDEHVNDHQLDFCLKVQKQGYHLYVIEDVSQLLETINQCENQVKIQSNTNHFIENFEKEIEKLFEK